MSSTRALSVLRSIVVGQSGLPGPPRALELGSYLLLALIAVSPALLSARHVVGADVDLNGSLWFFWWIRDCVENLRDPTFTELFFYPHGKQIFSHTGANFVDALLSLPFQWILGFPRYQPVFSAFILIANALCFRPLVYRLVDRRLDDIGPLPLLMGHRLSWGAFLAVLLWMSSSYVLFELCWGRPTQALLVFLPLAVHAFLRLEQRPERLGLAVQTGLFCGLGAWTYWFEGWFLALLFSWLTLTGLLAARARGESTLPLLKAVLRTVLMTALVVSPAVLPMVLLALQGRVPAIAGSGEGFLEVPAIVLKSPGSTLRPGPLVWSLLSTFSLGLSLVGAFFLARGRLRWIGAAGISTFFALGLCVELPFSDIVLPIYPNVALWHGVPFLKRLLFPHRALHLTLFCVALLAGISFEALRARLPRRPATFLPLLILPFMGLHLGELRAREIFPLSRTDITIPGIFDYIRQSALGSGRVEALIHLPVSDNEPSILYQLLHRQPLFGGMGENAPLLWDPAWAQELDQPMGKFFRGVTRNPRTRAPSRAQIDELRAQGFRWLVLHRDAVEDSPKGIDTALAFEVSERLSELFGQAIAVEGALVLWDLDRKSGEVPGFAPGLVGLREKTWRTRERVGYERILGAQSKGGAPENRHSGRD